MQKVNNIFKRGKISNIYIYVSILFLKKNRYETKQDNKGT